ncbi:MAG: hypothetical protein K0S82_1780 [Gaiellaceae bacterium]|jgi:hypothetical protein|nr:hypothetical protein [Gaiellaceae bacterium]
MIHTDGTRTIANAEPVRLEDVPERELRKAAFRLKRLAPFRYRILVAQGRLPQV